MAAPDTTKYQINYKLADGTLINLYATDVKDLETGLADLGMVASLIKSTGADLSGNALASATAAITASFPTATPVATPAPAPAVATGGNSCKHGAMVYKEGVSAKGPWKAWMCAAPKGAPDKCDAIWIR
jgi:hypothetical protein